MSGCSNLRAQLDEGALGGPATPALGNHLAECATCAAELERRRALVRRMDAAVHSVVRAEPPEHLIATVTTRLGAARGPASRHGVRRWSAALAVAAVFALLITAGFRAFERPPVAHSELSALSAWRSPTDSLLQPLGISPQALPTPGATHES